MKAVVTVGLLTLAALAGLAGGAGSADGGGPGVVSAAPDDRLAIAQRGIVLVDPDGGNKRVLTDRRGWLDYSPAWSPDARRIAFTRTTDNYRSFHVYVMRADGRGVHRLTDGRFDESPDWSPDGRAIAYGSMRGIKIIRPDGSGKRGVTGTREAGDPAWSPDGRRLAFAQRGYVWTAKPNGRDRRRIVRGREPDWSPDGRRIAYVPRNGGVATVGVDGKGRRFLGKGLQPAWSPDGDRIAYARWPANEVFSVWLMSAQGEHVRRVTRQGAYPAWRPVPR